MNVIRRQGRHCFHTISDRVSYFIIVDLVWISCKDIVLVYNTEPKPNQQ